MLLVSSDLNDTSSSHSGRKRFGHMNYLCNNVAVFRIDRVIREMNHFRLRLAIRINTSLLIVVTREMLE